MRILLLILIVQAVTHTSNSFQEATSLRPCLLKIPQRLVVFSPSTDNPKKKQDGIFQLTSTTREFSPTPITNSVALYTPIWTSLAALGGIWKPSLISSTLGSMAVMQLSLATLMLAMGMTITPKDISRALQKPSTLGINVMFCFGLMPALAYLIGKVFSFSPSLMAGIVLLGSVSGGQASNLFALLAGGDVALSVICTLSTTLLGVLATPLLVKALLGYSVAVNGVGMIQSVASLVLLPLLSGLALNRFTPRLVERIIPSCPVIGVCATMILVAGGAANSVSSFGVDLMRAIVTSFIYPIIGGGLALAFSQLVTMSEKSRRTLVVETLSKSPTLAYVLARTHFGLEAAAIPAAAMVSLALVGALVASLWAALDNAN